MVTSVPMPKLGAGVYNEGVILKWLKKEGEHVGAQEPLAEIETEKAIVTFESPLAGTVLKLLFQEGETVEVGKTILLIGDPSEVGQAEVSPHNGPVTEPARPSSAPATHAAVAEISPAARKLAENLKVDLSNVVGTGPNGSVMRQDILKAAREGKSTAQVAVVGTESAPTNEGGKVIPLSQMRQTIAERLNKSQREAAHVTLTREAEVSVLVDLVKSEGTAMRFGYNDVLIKSVAEALKQFPMMNSRLEGNNIRTIDAINIGVAVSLEGGLITPTIKSADALGVTEIAEAVRQLSEKARERSLTAEEYSQGSFTISNLGAYGVEAFTPIINPPQVGILGVGRIMERPWVVDGEVRARPTVHLSLTFDHRVVDGAEAAKFLDAIVHLVRDLSWLQV
jgi:pyruvate dehydrogenase E2 component (dihydrolipoamide acetyltransferase)